MTAQRDGGEAHPLFLPETEDDELFPAERIHKIYVKRFEKHGGATNAPRGYGPAELRDEQVLFEMFGGGSYELFARTAKGQILGRSTITLPGKSKPLDGQPIYDDEEEDPRRAPQHAAMPAGALDPMQMIIMMMQMQERSSKEMIQMMMNQQAQAAQAQAAQTQVLVAALSGAGSSSTALMQAFSPILTQALGRDRGNPVQDARAIVDLAKDLAIGSEIVDEPSEDSSILSTIGQVMQGAAALNASQAQQQQAAHEARMLQERQLAEQRQAAARQPPPLRAVSDSGSEGDG